jgi:hypothetical protein
MPEHFDLVIAADYASRTAEFSLRDKAGVQLAYQHTDFKTIPAGRQLLGVPAFAALTHWLQQHQIDVDKLQAALDQFLDRARELARDTK